ncbi:MAG: hypothetical protein Q9160_003675 [Pyrenula sp. 1 TL-2023]
MDQSTINVPEDDQHFSLGLRMLDEANFTDLKVVCNGHTFNVHRSVVCARSPWFKRACMNGLKVNSWASSLCELTIYTVQESHEQVIDLPDDYPAVIARMLFFLYTGTMTGLLSGRDRMNPSATDMVRDRVLSNWIPCEDVSGTGCEMLPESNRATRLDPVTFITRIFIAADKYLVDDAMKPALHQLHEESLALSSDDKVTNLYAVMNAARLTMAKIPQTRGGSVIYATLLCMNSNISIRLSLRFGRGWPRSAWKRLNLPLTLCQGVATRNVSGATPAAVGF